MDLFKNGVGRPSNETIKKRNIFKGICAILVIIIIGLVCYIVKNNEKTEVLKDNSDKEVVTTKKESKEEVNSNLSDKAESLLEIFNSANNQYNLNEDEKSVFGYFYKDDRYLDNIDNDIILLTALLDIDKNDTIITEKELDAKIIEIFGNVHYSNKTIETLCNQFVYDKENKSYKLDGGCSGDTPMIESKIIDVKEEGEKLIIKNIIAISDFDQEKENSILYKDFDRKIVIKEDYSFDNGISEFENKLDLFKWIFTKDSNGNYVFESVEKRK